MQVPNKKANNSKKDNKVDDLFFLLQQGFILANRFKHRLANISGFNANENICLEYLLDNSEVTAGDLAKLTDLTTGAITALIDRLEKSGLVERVADKKDRRKTILKLKGGGPPARLPKKLPRINPFTGQEMPKELRLIIENFGDKFNLLLRRYDEEQLAFLISFFEDLVRIYEPTVKDLGDYKIKSNR